MRKTRQWLKILVIWTIVLSTGEAPAATVPVGVAKVDITPETPVRMYGYGARKTESEGVAATLTAKALALGDDGGEGPAVLLMVENGAMLPDMVAEVLRRVQAEIPIKAERFVLCHTHLHSGPDVKGIDALSGDERARIQAYCCRLKDQLVSVAVKALNARRPCHLTWAEGKVGYAANRRVLKDGRWAGFGAVPDAPADHSLPMLCATDLQGKPVAVVVNYACHCTTLRGNFKKIHGDWAGSAMKYIEADHPGLVALTCIGCGADADPHPHSTQELAEKHGRTMADEVARLLKGPMMPVSTELTAKRTTLQLPFQKAPDNKTLQTMVKTSWSLGEVQARLKKGESLGNRPYAITTWAFGPDMAMVFLTGEVVVDIGLRLKQMLQPRRVWISAYTHEVPCYIVSQRILKEGGYEERNSMSSRLTFGKPETFQPPMEDRVADAVRRMLSAPER